MLDEGPIIITAIIIVVYFWSANGICKSTSDTRLTIVKKTPKKPRQSN